MKKTRWITVDLGCSLEELYQKCLREAAAEGNPIFKVGKNLGDPVTSGSNENSNDKKKEDQDGQ